MVRRTWHSCQPIDLHRLARRYFVNAKRIEMQRLARDLGISRATAYRWAGSAELLIGEVLASLVEDTFQTLLHRTADKKGSERVIEVLELGIHYAHDFPALRRFLRRNPEQGLKIVASKEGVVQAKTIEKIEQLLKIEIDAGHMTLDVSTAAMAYALTRIIESFLYADLIADEEPDIDSASAIIRLMLRESRSTNSVC